jgi:hypothetical protein
LEKTNHGMTHIAHECFLNDFLNKFENQVEGLESGPTLS